MSTLTTSGIWETTSCGLTLRIPCPKTTTEIDRAAGYVGAAHEAAIRYFGLHDTLEIWQEKFADAIEDRFKILRKINEEATAKNRAIAANSARVQPIYETVKKYVARCLAILPPEDQLALKLLAQTVADATPVDPSPTQRRGLISNESYAKADSLLTAPIDIYEEKISLYSEYVGGYIIDRNGENRPTRDSLARLIQTYLKRRDDNVRAEIAMQD